MGLGVEKLFKGGHIMHPVVVNFLLLALATAAAIVVWTALKLRKKATRRKPRQARAVTRMEFFMWYGDVALPWFFGRKQRND